MSLVMLDPLAFLNLKFAGRCEFEIPETFFDSDYPGQYMRRLRSISLTIPCVVGRHTSVNCVLTLLKHTARVSSDVGVAYEEDLTTDDKRFTTRFAAVQSIVTSHAQNDNGLFETDPKDGRFLPFRGAGAVSRWSASLPLETNALDRNSLTDFLLHLTYTSREGGALLQAAAWKAREKALKDPAAPPQRRLFSAKFESRDEWHQFLHPRGTTGGQAVTIALTSESLGPLFKETTLTVSEVDVYLHFKHRGSNGVYQGGGGVLSVTASHRAGTVATPALVAKLESVDADLAGAPHASVPLAFDVKPGVIGTLRVEIPEASIAGIAPELVEPIPGTTHVRLKADAIDDVSVMVRYTVK